MTNNPYQQIGTKLSEEYGTSMGQMFGKPCLKAGKKAFAVSFQEEMVFKLGKVEVDLLKDKYEGSQNFDPSGKGRPMKDWIQVPTEYAEDWLSLAKQAMEFVNN